MNKIFSILLIILMAGFLGGCGEDNEENLKKSDIRIVSPVGSSYPSISGYVFSLAVESFNEIPGNVTDLQVELNRGNQLLLKIDKNSYKAYVGNSDVWWGSGRVEAYKTIGLVFSGERLSGTPDNAKETVSIKDDNGYSYILTKTVNLAPQ